MVFSGELRDTNGAVGGFVSIEGYQGAPGIVVPDDGIFEVAINDDSIEDSGYTVYIFGKGQSGGPVIVVNFSQHTTVHITVNVETKEYRMVTG